MLDISLTNIANIMDSNEPIKNFKTSIWVPPYLGQSKSKRLNEGKKSAADAMYQVNNGTEKNELRKKTIDKENTDPVSKCDICRKRFRNNHLKRQYVYIQRYVCSTCNNEYNISSQSNVSSNRTQATHDKKKKRMQRLESIIEQIKLHSTKQETTGDVQCKKVRSQICNKEVSKNNFKVHEQIYTNKRLEKVPCKFCNKEICKASIKRHERAHTDEKLYTCIVCNTKFHRKETLDQHILIHENEKKYICDVYDKAFKQKCNLYKHKKREHILS